MASVHTMNKNNSRNAGNINIVVRIKLNSKLRNSSSEVGYYSYTNRWHSYKEKQ